MGLESILATVSKTSGPPRLIEMGKLKLGGLGAERTTKDGRKWRLPRKDDHFTITSLIRDDKGDLTVDTSLMTELIKQYGDKDGKLRQIPIRLLSDNIDECLMSRFVWYGKKTAGAVSDGETVTWKYDPVTFQPLDPPRVEEWKPEMLDMQDKSGHKLFKLHTVFSVIVASTESRFGGVYKLRTTSVISFKQLYASLVHISQLTGGTLVGMPLMLCVRPMQVAPDGQPTRVHVVHVELRGPDLQAIQNIALEQAKFRLTFKQSIEQVQRQYQKLLVAPGEESLEDAADIAAEFAPVEQEQDDVPEPPEDVLGGVANLLDGDVGKRDGRGTPAEQQPEAAKPDVPEEAPSVAQAASEAEPEQTAEGSAVDVDAANRAMDEAAAPVGRRGKKQ